MYFDYKRRNDPRFRRQLRREKKKAKQQLEEQERLSQSQMSVSIENALQKALDKPLPKDPAQKEQMFMEQVAEGERYAAMGEAGFEDAAVCFYRALKVYPDPLELIMIYQKTIPQSVLSVIMGMLSQDVKRRQENYYNAFPPEEMHVKIKELSKVAATGETLTYKTMVANKDFAVGDAIYTESPETTLLMPGLTGPTHCDYCLRTLDDSSEALRCDTCHQVAFCCETCKTTAEEEYHRYLCPGSDTEPKAAAQQLAGLWADKHVLTPLLIAKFFGHMIHVEKKKQEAGEEPEYTVWERLEHLKFLELTGTDDDAKSQELVCDLIGSKITGLENFMNKERYLMLKGKMLYNAIGVRADGSSCPVSLSGEYTRAASTDGLVGAGLYLVSSYLNHSCEPNAVPTFPDGSSRLVLQATRPIKMGDEITMTYIAVGDRPAAARQQELMEKYRLTCSCPLCASKDE
ncbi:mitochondrial import receptor subunit tom20 [Dimargaris xerosporica]|nr:mitochondrial import receptor subunit tom20 [Dimargaris xerosporica]